MLLLSAPLPAMTVLAARASVSTGALIASGDYIAPLAAQGLRTSAAACLVAFGAPAWWVPLALCIGEVGRLLAMEHRAQRRSDLNGAGGGHFRAPTLGGLVAQSASMLTSNLNPVVDRLFLASGPAGGIVSYETADRLFFGVSHALNSGTILPVVRRWPRLIGQDLMSIRRTLRGDVRGLALLCCVVALVATPLCYAGFLGTRRLELDALNTGFLWAMLQMVSLPFTLLNTMGARLIILTRRAHWLVGIAGAALAINVIADAVFFRLLGPIGIPVATVVLRVLIGLGFAALILGPLSAIASGVRVPARSRVRT